MIHASGSHETLQPYQLYRLSNMVYTWYENADQPQLSNFRVRLYSLFQG